MAKLSKQEAIKLARESKNKAMSRLVKLTNQDFHDTTVLQELIVQELLSRAMIVVGAIDDDLLYKIYIEAQESI